MPRPETAGPLDPLGQYSPSRKITERIAEMSEETLLRQAASLAGEWLESLPTRPVHARASLAELRAALGGELPAKGEEASAVIDALAERAEPGLIASPGPRYFGFVIGGSLPV